MIKREDIDENVLVSLNKRNENWQIVEDIKNDLATQKEDYANQVDFKIRNEIVNGDFSNGMNSWGRVRYDLPVIINDNIASFTAIARYNHIYHTIGGVNIGDKLYATATIKTNKTNVKFILSHKDGYTFSKTDHTGDNQFERLSILGDIPLDVNVGFLRLMVQDHNVADWTPIHTKEVITVNLTKFFGTGNEPTKEEMDELIDLIGWFDGEITLTQKQIAIWTLNMIRQNRNALVALGGTTI